MAKQTRKIWTEKLGLVHPLPFSGVMFSEIRHLATIPIFWSNQGKKSTRFTKLNYTVLWLYYKGCTQKNKKNIPLPKQLQSAWRYYWLFTMYIKTLSGFRLCKWNAKLPLGKSSSEHRLTISHKTGRDWKYIAKDLELDGKPRKMWMERNRPVETSQLVKEDNLLKQTVFFW